MEVPSLRSSLGRVIVEGIHESERYEVQFTAIHLVPMCWMFVEMQEKRKTKSSLNKSDI